MSENLTTRAEQIAERIRKWVDYEIGLFEFSALTVDEGRAIKTNAGAIAAVMDDVASRKVSCGWDYAGLFQHYEDEREARLKAEAEVGRLREERDATNAQAESDRECAVQLSRRAAVAESTLTALRGLVEEWRESARVEAEDRDPGWVGAQAAYITCADMLDARLAN